MRTSSPCIISVISTKKGCSGLSLEAGGAGSTGGLILDFTIVDTGWASLNVVYFCLNSFLKSDLSLNASLEVGPYWAETDPVYILANIDMPRLRS